VRIAGGKEEGVRGSRHGGMRGFRRNSARIGETSPRQRKVRPLRGTG
jgi:hypothetical protein